MGNHLKDPNPTRPSLLRRVKNGEDEESWKEFVAIYRPMIYGEAIRAGLTHSDADDVAQETLLLLWKKMPGDNGFKYDPSRSFKGWVRQTARWRIGDRFREQRAQGAVLIRRANTATRTSTLERLPDKSAAGWDEKWERDMKTHLVDRALKRIRQQVNARHYLIFDFYVLKRWPTEKVAREMGVSASQVYVITNRVLARIKKEVERLRSEPI
jgi:RNA polymerase sigma factor (sigma-70 family)